MDVDICYDKYGFPYIPAKRIRGCLRECAVELQDWNLDIPWKKMFGQAGDSKHRAAVRISDAHLAGYEEMKELVRKNGDKTVFHPQNVLSHFTYIRTQTSIDPETGVADAASLRTMRVADKDLTFIAEVDMDPVYREELKKCCAVFRHIGISLSLIHILNDPSMSQDEAISSTAQTAENYLNAVDEFQAAQLGTGNAVDASASVNDGISNTEGVTVNDGVSNTEGVSADDGVSNTEGVSADDGISGAEDIDAGEDLDGGEDCDDGMDP